MDMAMFTNSSLGVKITRRRQFPSHSEKMNKHGHDRKCRLEQVIVVQKERRLADCQSPKKLVPYSKHRQETKQVGTRRQHHLVGAPSQCSLLRSCASVCVCVCDKWYQGCGARLWLIYCKKKTIKKFLCSAVLNIFLKFNLVKTKHNVRKESSNINN